MYFTKQIKIFHKYGNNGTVNKYTWHVSWHPVTLSLAFPIIPIIPIRVKDDQSFSVWHCTCVRAPSSALTEARIGRDRSPSGQVCLVHLSGQAKTPLTSEA